MFLNDILITTIKFFKGLLKSQGYMALWQKSINQALVAISKIIVMWAVMWAACCISYELQNVYTIWRGGWYVAGKEWKVDNREVKSSRLSYSLVESLPPRTYLMPVMIDFFLITWRSSCAKRSGCRVITLQLSMKQLYFHTSWYYNERKSLVIFALSATLASFAWWHVSFIMKPR